MGDTDYFRESPGLYCPSSHIQPMNRPHHADRRVTLAGDRVIPSLPGFECLQGTPPNVGALLAIW